MGTDHPFKDAATANPMLPADLATAIERHAVFVAHDLADIRTRDLDKTKLVILIDYANLVFRQYLYSAQSSAADDGYTAIWDNQERVFALQAGQSFEPDIIVADITARDALDVSAEAVGYSVLVTGTSELHFLTDPATPTWSAGVSFGAGTPGASGADGGLAFDFASSTTMGDPGAGKLRFNNATIASVTSLAVDDALANTGNPDVAIFINSWGDSTSAVKGHILIQKASAKQNYAVFAVTSVTDNTGWSRVYVTHVDSTGSFSDTDRLAVIFTRNGDKGDQGVQGDPGNDGSNGANGADGNDGFSPGYRFAWSTNITDTDPGSGNVKANHGTFASVTKLWFDNEDAAAASVATWLDGLDDSTTAGDKGRLRVQKADDPDIYREFKITGSVVDKTGYREVPVSPVAQAGALADTDEVTVLFTRTGDKGADGAGSGDMVAATYDPGGVADDAFDMASMVEAADAKVMTGAERTKLGHVSVTQAVDLDAIETRVNDLDAAIILQGTWDASSGSFPGGGSAQAGESWIVSLAGTVDGVAFAVDDRIIATADNASTSTFTANWHKADYTDLVQSVAGKTGAVTLVAADVTDLGDAATLDEATAAQFRDNTADKLLSTDRVWDAAAEVTLTDAATIAVDMDGFINAKVTLGGNRTLGNPTNEKVGQEGVIRVIQDGTGSRTLSFGADYEFAGGTAPTLSTGANDEDLLFYKVLAADRVFIAPALDIS